MSLTYQLIQSETFSVTVYVIYVGFVCFLPESSMLDIDCIDSNHRLSLSKFWGFPKREELEFLHCD